MILKMDITQHCNLENLPEVARVFNCYRSPEDEVTYICSSQKMIYAEDLGCQIDYKGEVPEERMEEIEDLFRSCDDGSTYYDAGLVDSLPRLPWGSFPEVGTVGCVIESPGEYEDKQEEIDDFFSNGG